MSDTDRDVRRAVYDGDGRPQPSAPRPPGRRGGGGPPARGVSAQIRRLLALVVIVAVVAGMVKAGGWVLNNTSSPATAPAADPHGPGIPVAIPPGDDATAIAGVLQ